VAHKGEGQKVCKVLMGMTDGKRPLGSLRHRWEDGIRMHLREIRVFWDVALCNLEVD
jgi:hypothetical protein